MSTRINTRRVKTMGVAAAITAIAVAIPTSVQAYADPNTDPSTPATPTTIATPAFKAPDPQGPGCDAYNKRIPTGAGSFVGMQTQNASSAIASNPDLSMFSDAISGKLDPAVNIISALDGGPYIVFAPTNDAFAKLEPSQLEALKTNPALLTSTLYYHMVLGFLSPDDVHGKMPTQQGKVIDVTGKGGDIQVNGVAKVVCGGITAKGASIYMIDTVLDPAEAPEPIEPVAPTTTSSAAPTSTSAEPSAASASQPSTTTSGS